MASVFNWLAVVGWIVSSGCWVWAAQVKIETFVPGATIKSQPFNEYFQTSARRNTIAGVVSGAAALCSAVALAYQAAGGAGATAT